MLVFLPPSADMLPALEAYRNAALSAGDELDGCAGLGGFSSLSDWLERVRTLASPAAEKRGWRRTEGFRAVRIAEGCSLSARHAAEYDALPDLVGMGNVRFPGNSPADQKNALLAGHIGYHVKPDERRKGYGAAILRHAVTLCRKRGIAEPLVCVLTDNLPSLRAAQSVGFVPEARGRLTSGEAFIRLRLPARP